MDGVGLSPCQIGFLYGWEYVSMVPSKPSVFVCMEFAGVLSAWLSRYSVGMASVIANFKLLCPTI